MKIQANNLPTCLREKGHFCCWKYEPRDGSNKPTKVPYNPRTGGKAQSTNPDTFAPLDVALRAAEQGQFDGIGVGIFDGVCAIDIDHCIDENGKLSDLALDVVNTMEAYTEFSPSGQGIRILFTVPDGFQYDKNRYYINKQNIGLEVYVAKNTNKYVTVTGNTLNPGMDMKEQSEQLAVVLEKYMKRPQHPIPTPPVTTGPVDMDDAALLDKARSSKNGVNFSALWAGNITGYKSHSEADAALCFMLAFWTGCDPARMDRLFRQSGLMRKKWDEQRGGRTYGMITIQESISNTTEIYDPAAYYQQEVGPEMKKEEPPKPSLSTISAEALQQKAIPPIRWIAEDLLPTGLTVWASPPKLGKSWLALLLAFSVTMNRTFLGYNCCKCGVLYLSLEDSERRLQDRMRKVLGPVSAPPDFFFATQAPTLSNGLMDALETHMKEHPDTGLIIIDTLAKVRDVGSGRDVYGKDYADVGELKRFADTHNIAVLLIHHLRKTGDDADVFNRISGTNGIMGAADTMMVLHKEKRVDETATLNITGRDIEENELVLRFNKQSFKWENMGNADWFAEQQARSEYQNSPIVKTVKKLVEQSPNGWIGTTQQLMDEGRYIVRTSLADTTQALTNKLKGFDDLLLECDGIVHERKDNGTGGKKHKFRYVNAPQFEEVAQMEFNPFVEP